MKRIEYALVGLLTLCSCQEKIDYWMTDAEGTKLGGVAEGATKVEASETNGNVKINGVDTKVYTEPSDVVHGAIATDTEVTEMLNEVFAATV